MQILDSVNYNPVMAERVVSGRLPYKILHYIEEPFFSGMSQDDLVLEVLKRGIDTDAWTPEGMRRAAATLSPQVLIGRL